MPTTITGLKQRPFQRLPRSIRAKGPRMNDRQDPTAHHHRRALKRNRSPLRTNDPPQRGERTKSMPTPIRLEPEPPLEQQLLRRNSRMKRIHPRPQRPIDRREVVRHARRHGRTIEWIDQNPILIGFTENRPKSLVQPRPFFRRHPEPRPVPQTPGRRKTNRSRVRVRKRCLDLGQPASPRHPTDRLDHRAETCGRRREVHARYTTRPINSSSWRRLRTSIIPSA